MIDFKKEDIPALDFIINKLIEDEFMVSSNDLVNAGILKVNNRNNEKEWDKAETEFIRLMFIIEEFKCGNCKTNTSTDMGASISPNSKTSYFKANGGFEKAYLDLTENNKRSEILKDKELNDAKLSKWQVKYFWYIFAFGLLGGIYSTVEIIKSLTIKEDVKEKPISKAELESEIAKLRTLILDQKRIDSLRNSKNHVVLKTK